MSEHRPRLEVLFSLRKKMKERGPIFPRSTGSWDPNRPLLKLRAEITSPSNRSAGVSLPAGVRDASSFHIPNAIYLVLVWNFTHN